MSGPHPIRDRKTVAAYLNDTAFHLKLAERSLVSVENEFSGSARSLIRGHIGTCRRLRRRVLRAIDRAGVSHRGSGFGG